MSLMPRTGCIELFNRDSGNLSALPARAHVAARVEREFREVTAPRRWRHDNLLSVELQPHTIHIAQEDAQRRLRRDRSRGPGRADIEEHLLLGSIVNLDP